jgi:hypothetical protein
VQDELPRIEQAYEDLLREMRRASAGPIIMLPASGGHIAEQFPAVAAWVQGYGHIEIGDQEGFGFVVRALDYGGLVFEDDKAGTLVEAMAVLEKGLRKWFGEQGIDLE